MIGLGSDNYFCREKAKLRMTWKWILKTRLFSYDMTSDIWYLTWYGFRKSWLSVMESRQSLQKNAEKGDWQLSNVHSARSRKIQFLCNKEGHIAYYVHKGSHLTGSADKVSILEQLGEGEGVWFNPNFQEKNIFRSALTSWITFVRTFVEDGPIYQFWSSLII